MLIIKVSRLFLVENFFMNDKGLRSFLWKGCLGLEFNFISFCGRCLFEVVSYFCIFFGDFFKVCGFIMKGTIYYR